MSGPSCFLVASVLVSGALLSGPAAAVMYRCDGNLVTDSPTRGTNCIAMGSRMKSPTFSAELVEATIESQPTGAGRTGARPESATSSGRATGAVKPGASAKP